MLKDSNLIGRKFKVDLASHLIDKNKYSSIFSYEKDEWVDHWLDERKTINVSNKMWSQFKDENLIKRVTKERQQFVPIILANLLFLSQYCKYSKIRWLRFHFNTSGKMDSPINGVGNKPLVDFIKSLKDGGYVNFITGRSSNGEITRILALPKLEKCFGHLKVTHGISRKPKNTKLDHKFNAHDANLHKYNKLMESQKYTIDREGQQIDLLFDHYFISKKSDQNKHQGRMHSQFQNLRKDYRSTLEINGKETVELDFSASQLRIIHAINNVTVPSGDLYSVAGWSTEDRKELKWAGMKLIHGKGDKRIKIDLKKVREVAKDTLGHDCSSSAIEELVSKTVNEIQTKKRSAINAMKKKYKGIKDWDGVKAYLQEALVARRVTEEMTKLDKPVIAIHDGFVCCKEDKDVLFSIMTSAWKDVVGNDSVISEK